MHGLALCVASWPVANTCQHGCRAGILVVESNAERMHMRIGIAFLAGDTPPKRVFLFILCNLMKHWRYKPIAVCFDRLLILLSVNVLCSLTGIISGFGARPWNSKRSDTTLYPWHSCTLACGYSVCTLCNVRKASSGRRRIGEARGLQTSAKLHCCPLLTH